LKYFSQAKFREQNRAMMANAFTKDAGMQDLLATLAAQEEAAYK
jgi:hypothetical protein